MRYVIIGAGAIGGVVGGRLAQNLPSTPPLLIARGEHGAMIAANGLRVRSPDSDDHVHVPTATGPADTTLREDDVLVFATKTQQVSDALQQWVDQPVLSASGSVLGTAGDLLPVFTALNGVESERIAARYFARVFAVCVWMPAMHLTPGEVVIRIAPSSGTFLIGRYGAKASPSDEALLASLRTDWEAATFRIFTTDDIMGWKYRKLLANLGNAVQALIGPSSTSPRVADRLRDEAHDVYRAAELTWPTDAAEDAWRGDAFDVRPVPGLEGAFGGSSWQSMQRGTGSIETDFLNGEIVLMARTLGLEAPQNAVVQRLAREASARHAGVESMTEEDLIAALDDARR